jgi:methylenetetrahydrofolate dehydrogenase (NADP+)/methenyltetrahydrofolate cyclohydrolase
MPTSPLEILSKPVVENLAADTSMRAKKVAKARGFAPKLVVVLVGEDPASVIYTSNKGKAALACGLEHETIRLPATTPPEQVRLTIERLNQDPRVDGILVQRPLPKSFKEEEVVYWIDPAKDVDAFHPDNTGRLQLSLPCLKPCTPSGIMKMLEHYGFPTRGKHACIVGRSSIVGKPMAALLLHADATVTIAHSRTSDLEAVTKQADILVAAIGKPLMIKRHHVKTGAIVIDVGINRLENGKIVGDVDYHDVAPVVAAITPVPRGVGPMTIAMLLQNTVWAAERRVSL